MSRFYGRITPGNGRPVQRQGHSAHGIDLHAAGADSGMHVEARADGRGDVFEVYATDGYRTSQSRYARTLLGTLAEGLWIPATDDRISAVTSMRPDGTIYHHWPIL